MCFKGRETVLEHGSVSAHKRKRQTLVQIVAHGGQGAARGVGYTRGDASEDRLGRGVPGSERLHDHGEKGDVPRGGPITIFFKLGQLLDTIILGGGKTAHGCLLHGGGVGGACDTDVQRGGAVAFPARDGDVSGLLRRGSFDEVLLLFDGREASFLACSEENVADLVVAEGAVTLGSTGKGVGDGEVLVASWAHGTLGIDVEAEPVSKGEAKKAGGHVETQVVDGEDRQESVGTGRADGQEPGCIFGGWG